MADGRKWLFVYIDDDMRPMWWLKIDSLDLLYQYYKENPMFEKDRKHWHKIQNTDDTRYIVAHTNWGYFADWAIKNLGATDIDDGYSTIAQIQYDSMRDVLEKEGEIYVNRAGGFSVSPKDKKHIGFVHKANLEYPQYLSSQIRIKRFPDAAHYYAYIGDMQVRDGDTLKWDTFEEAENAAKQYASDYTYQKRYQKM